MDFVDFYIVTPNGPLLKSKMADGVWKEFYPKESWQINGFIYRLISESASDLYVRGYSGDVRIGKTNLGQRRFFCHHNGRAFIASGGESQAGEHIATTFGAIYETIGLIHKFKFFMDGTFEFDAEEFHGIQPVL